MKARSLLVLLALAPGPAQAAATFDFGDDQAGIPTHFLTFQTGVNFGLLELGLQSGHFVASVSTNVGWSVVTDGRFTFADVRFGYAWALSPPDETMWFFDLVADVLPGRAANGPLTGPFADPHAGVLCAFGLSLGFRFVHRSGLVLGFRLPLVGIGVGDWLDEQAQIGGFDVGRSMTAWIMALGLSTSLFTVGLRF